MCIFSYIGLYIYLHMYTFFFWLEKGFLWHRGKTLSYLLALSLFLLYLSDLLAMGIYSIFYKKIKKILKDGGEVLFCFLSIYLPLRCI